MNRVELITTASIAAASLGAIAGVYVNSSTSARTREVVSLYNTPETYLIESSNSFRYSVKDIAEDIATVSRQFTTDEAEGYHRFIDEYFG